MYPILFTTPIVQLSNISIYYHYIGWHISSLTIFKIVLLKNFLTVFDNFLTAYRGDVRNMLTSFPGLLLDYVIYGHWLEPAALEGRFSSFLRMTFHISECLWLRISVQCIRCLKEFSKFLQLQTSHEMLGAILFAEWMLSSNQRIDLSDMWHLAPSCWNNPFFDWRNKILWTTLSLKAGLTIFIKDVGDVVIRVNLYFLHN